MSDMRSDPPATALAHWGACTLSSRQRSCTAPVWSGGPCGLLALAVGPVAQSEPSRLSRGAPLSLSPAASLLALNLHPSRVQHLTTWWWAWLWQRSSPTAASSEWGWAERVAAVCHGMYWCARRVALGPATAALW